MKRKILKIIISFLSIGAGILGLSIIIKGLYDDYLEENANKAIVTKDYDYQVLFEPNDFYSHIDSQEENYFPSKLVEAIDIDLYYKNADLIPQKYDYQISMTLVGEIPDANGILRTIWQKKFDFEKGEDLIPDPECWELNKHLTIDYKDYEAIVKAYKMTCNLKINTTLKINLDIIGYTDTNDFKDTIQLSIPIDENITTIDADFDKTNTIYYAKAKKHNISYYLCGLILLIISGSYIIVMAKRSNRDKDQLKPLLREYRGLIIPIKDNLNIEKIPFIDVKTSDDIIDIALENRTNILYYDAHIESYFYVITEYVIYRFIA